MTHTKLLPGEGGAVGAALPLHGSGSARLGRLRAAPSKGRGSEAHNHPQGAVRDALQGREGSPAPEDGDAPQRIGAPIASSSYTLRRVFGPVWRWDADYRGEALAHGRGMGKAHARWRARYFLRGRRAAARRERLRFGGASAE